MSGTWSGSAQSPKDQNKNSIIISNSIITGGTGIYSKVKRYGTGKGEFNPGTGYTSNTNTIFYEIAK